MRRKEKEPTAAGNKATVRKAYTRRNTNNADHATTTEPNAIIISENTKSCNVAVSDFAFLCFQTITE